MPEERTLIGFAELVDLPEWGIEGLRGKVDTGARTSALHVSNIRELTGGRVGFDVRLHRRNVDRIVHVETRVTRRGRVRPSSGDAQSRLFVSTRLRIGPVERVIEVSLVDREHMIYRMLVGRSALGPGLLVDPQKRYVLTKRGRKPAKLTSRKARKAS